MQDQFFNAETFLRFLKNVLIRYPQGKIVMVLDNVRIHHAKLIHPFLEEQKNRLELLFPPPIVLISIRLKDCGNGWKCRLFITCFMSCYKLSVKMFKPLLQKLTAYAH